MAAITKNIDECVNYLLKGNLVSFPTETVYGLGANIYDEEAVNKIFDYKDRPKSNPLIVHIDSIDKINDLVDLNDDNMLELKNIMNMLTPGPISFLLPKTDKVPNYITADSDHVCIRIPSNTTALELLKKVKVPICAPSANIYCHVSPVKAKHVLSEFKDKKLLILEDIYDDNVIGIESTIIKIDFDHKNLIFLRPGFITPSMLMSICPKYDYSYDKPKEHLPGSSSKHYSINKEIYIINNKNILKNISLENISVIEFGDTLSNSKNFYSLSKNNNYVEAMQNFYEILRECENDLTEKLYICIEPNEDNHFYVSLFDRMIKCANNKILSSINTETQYNLKKY